MPHDGQDLDLTMTEPVILPDLLALTKGAISPAETLLKKGVDILRDKVSEDGRIQNRLIEANQTAAHGLAWLATYVESLRQMQKWASKIMCKNNC